MDDLAAYLKNYVSGYSVMSCNQIYSQFSQFKEVLVARSGFIEAVPKGKTKLIGVVTFISPTGNPRVN